MTKGKEQAKEKFWNCQLSYDISTSTRALSDDWLALCKRERERSHLMFRDHKLQHERRSKCRLYLKNDILRQERHGHIHMTAVFLNTVLRIEVSRELTLADRYVKVYVLAPVSNCDVEVLLVAESVHSIHRCAEIQIRSQLKMHTYPSTRPLMPQTAVLTVVLTSSFH